MALLIADTATVDPRADLGDEVEIGPYCVVGPGVRIGRGTRLIAHACVLSPAALGEGNTVAPFAVIGSEPSGAGRRAGTVWIGDGNTIREGASVERSANAGGATVIGSGVIIGPHATIGRDSRIDDRVTIGAGARIGGGAVVEVSAGVAGGVEVCPRATVGTFGVAGGPGRIVHDVPSFVVVAGSPPRPRAANLVGLKRAGSSRTTLRALREAYRLIFRARMGTGDAARILAERDLLTPEVGRLLESLDARRDGRHGRSRDARVTNASGAA